MLKGRNLQRLASCVTKCLNCRAPSLPPVHIARPVIGSKRWYSSERSNYVQVENDDTVEGVAWVRLNRKPVNSLNTELLMELNIALENLENNETIRGAILTSANPGIFCAGLDITEMYQKDADYIRAYWRQFQDMGIKLFSTPLTIIAAINGHSPAGGCMMSLACDYRIMAAGNYGIGLNEVKLGIVAPQWLQDMMVSTVGQRLAESSLLLGTMFTPDEALSMGLVDEVVPLEDVESAAREEIKKWVQIPDMARTLTKQMLRNAAVEKFNNNRENELDLVSSFMASGSIQKSLGRYMEKLKKK